VLGFIGAQSVLKVCGSYCLLQVGQKLKQRMRRLLFSSVLGQDLGWVSSSRPAALVSQMASDTDELSRCTSASLAQAITSSATIVGALVQLTLISPQLTLLVVAIAPPIAAFAALASRFDRRLRRRYNEASTAGTISAGEAFSKLPTIQAYAQESQELRRYDATLEAEGRLQRRHLLFHKAWTTTLQLTTNVTTAVALSYAGVLASRGLVDPSMLLSFSQLSMSLSHGIGQFLFLLGDVAKLHDAAERIRQVAERQPAIPPHGATIEKSSPDLRGEISFEEVTFSYPARSNEPREPTLRALTLHLKAGSTTALVGPSGCGKTTVAHLIPRFYDVDGGLLGGDGQSNGAAGGAAGAVLLDGTDVRTLSPTWLRQEVVALVTQEPVLLPGTISENIAYGRPSASQASVRAAARAANAHGFISQLPQGYETELREGGGLSVGQRQRIAIARALPKDPLVLVMDEPTSALDSESEAAVQQALDRLAAGRTTLVIAHRLSTVRNADSIAVMQDGKIVEQGTHEELLKRGGEYAAMVKASERYEKQIASFSR